MLTNARRKITSAWRVVRTDPREARYKVRVRAWLALLAVSNRYSKRLVTGGAPVVVTVTSFGTRASLVHNTLESIAWGRARPSRLILWLDDPAILAALPIQLQRLQRRGLEILPCIDYGPHKKQYPYAVSLPKHDQALVTADDDILYPRYWLQRLAAAVEQFPDVVNCYRGHTMAIAEDRILPYLDWTACTSTDASFRTMSTGVSGVAYPPGLVEAFAKAGTEFLNTAPKNDDLWVHVVGVRNGYPTRQIAVDQAHFPTIPGSQVGTLFGYNVRSGGNDSQILRTYQPSDIAVIIDSPE